MKKIIYHFLYLYQIQTKLFFHEKKSNAMCTDIKSVIILDKVFGQSDDALIKTMNDKMLIKTEWADR